jgi:hypothetical protein
MSLFQEWWNASFMIRWLSVTGLLNLITWVINLIKLIVMFVIEVRKAVKEQQNV